MNGETTKTVSETLAELASKPQFAQVDGITARTHDLKDILDTLRATSSTEALKSCGGLRICKAKLGQGAYGA